MNEEYAYLYDLPRVDFYEMGLCYVPRIQYGREHPRQYMECFYPKGGEKMPVLVWVHGGAWKDENLTPAYRPEKALAELAEKGYFIACIEYRLAQHALFPACVEDCQAAVRYLRKHAGELNIDGDRIALWGESAGAHVVSMAGLNYNRAEGAQVQAVIAWYCPSDLVAEVEEKKPGEDEFESGLIGCPVLEYPEKAREASPVAYAGNAAPPFLLMHGDADDLVPYGQSAAFCEALCAAGNDARLITVSGQGHGFFRGEEYYEAIEAFLAEKMG